MITQITKTTFTGQKVFVGLDTHKKDFKVSILVEERFYKTFTSPPRPEHVVEYLLRNFPGAEYYSAYEAGFSGFWIHKKLTQMKVNSIVVNPADIPTTDKERTQKEDKRDSRKIAAQLQAGQLKGIYVPSDETLENRFLLRTRDTVVKDCARAKHRIKSSLFFFGIDFPTQFIDENTHWSNNFIKWLEAIDFQNTAAKKALAIKIDALKYTRQQLLIVTRQIRKLSNENPYKERVQLLISVPGIAMLTAMKFLTELETITRFNNFNQLCSYCGLIPATNSSSENERVSGITYRKNHVLRKALIESSWVAIRNDPALMKSYLTYTRRMKGTNAIIRIAKKILRRILHVLLKNEQYRKNILTNQ